MSRIRPILGGGRSGLPAWGLRLFALLTCCSVLGCGKGEPNRVAVSGTVTFNGKPIPQGKIYFTPDASKKNSGPQGFADIQDGAFDTKKTGQGAPAGPVIVRIEGFEPIAGGGDISTKPLFYPYETTATLPDKESTQTFTVPASATKRPAAQKPVFTGP